MYTIREVDNSTVVVQLQNNNLRSIPYELVDVVTLEEIDFSGNESLTMVPKLWQGDTNSVLFVCKVHRGECMCV